MQLNFIDTQQVSEVLAVSNILTTIEGPGNATTYVLEYGGQDILMVADSITGSAGVIYPCSSFDTEVGGSIHDAAREAMGAAGGADAVPD